MLPEREDNNRNDKAAANNDNDNVDDNDLVLMSKKTFECKFCSKTFAKSCSLGRQCYSSLMTSVG